MWIRLGITTGVAVPSIVVRLTGTVLSAELTVLVFGAGVVASAVLLSWAAEAAQVDISGSLAIAILALIAVLPEYAVDLYFSYTGGGDPTYTQFAAANMTGSNRLLIGIGWPVVAFVAFWALRRARRRGVPSPARAPRSPLAASRSIILARATASSWRSSPSRAPTPSSSRSPGRSPGTTRSSCSRSSWPTCGASPASAAASRS